MKGNFLMGAFLVVVFVGFVLGVMYVGRFFSAATLHTQVINPAAGIECVVVSATDSTSVDCWHIK